MARPRGSGLVPLVDRFYAKVNIIPGGCWEWLGSKPKGYGEISVEDYSKPNGWCRKRATHVIWYLETGEWPTKWMLHKCHNSICVNPDHLYEGTVLENNRDIHQRTRDLQKLVFIQAEVIKLLLQPGMLKAD